jgi:hypothetical protein
VLARTVKRLALGIFFILSLIAATAFGFVVGSRNTRSYAASELDATQASLSFNHLQRYKELESDLQNGCTKEALFKADVSVDQELALLANFFSRNQPPWVVKYVSARDPTLINHLKTFKSKYGARWSEPECKPLR